MAVDGGTGSMGVLVLAAVALACGDPRDARIAVVPEVAPARPVPILEKAPARAFVTLDIRSAADGGPGNCPQFATALGESRERVGPEGARGALRDEQDGVVQCVLRARDDAGDAYDAELVIEHERLPRLRVVGTAHGSNGAAMQLHVTTPDQLEYDATCNGAVTSLSTTSIQIDLTDCAGQRAGTSDSSCVATVIAGFENCAH